MAKLQLKRREKLDDRILGELAVFPKIGEPQEFCTLELPYKNNEKNISCIPLGKYKVSHRFSEKYGNHLKVENVPNRTDILIHVGNYPQDTHGCVLIGNNVRDINADGKAEVVNSKYAIRKLLNMLKDEKDISLIIME